jgi:DNA-directed RNA polymerase subunit RPC12/RpoP
MPVMHPIPWTYAEVYFPRADQIEWRIYNYITDTLLVETFKLADEGEEVPIPAEYRPGNDTPDPKTVPDQPDWIEVGTTMLDCGECGHSFLDRVFVYPDSEDEASWLACPNCGFEDRSPASPTVESDWYTHRY